MLPPGHLAAGFLTAKALLHFTHPALSSHQQYQLLWWGVFFGFAPDLDAFYAFAKVKALWFKPGANSAMHRQFYSHTPILWLIPGLLIYFFASSVYVKEAGLLLWLGSWSHFILDSIEYGVPWLWPFNKEVWALKDRGIRMKIEAKGFFQFWIEMLKAYTTRWTFYCEILILIVFLIIYFR